MQEKGDSQSRALGSLGKVGKRKWLCFTVHAESGCMCAPVSRTCIWQTFVCRLLSPSSPPEVVWFCHRRALCGPEFLCLFSGAGHLSALLNLVPRASLVPESTKYVCVHACVRAVSTNSHHLLCAGTRPMLSNTGFYCKCHQSIFSHSIVLQVFFK